MYIHIVWKVLQNNPWQKKCYILRLQRQSRRLHDNCHPYYMKQKHEIRFKTELRYPDGGNVRKLWFQNSLLLTSMYHFQDSPCYPSSLPHNSFAVKCVTNNPNFWNFIFTSVQSKRWVSPLFLPWCKQRWSSRAPQISPAHDCKHWLCWQNKLDCRDCEKGKTLSFTHKDLVL